METNDWFGIEKYQTTDDSGAVDNDTVVTGCETSLWDDAKTECTFLVGKVA